MLSTVNVNVSNEFPCLFFGLFVVGLSTENVPCKLFYHVSMETVRSPKSFPSLCLGEPCGSVHNQVAIQFLDLPRACSRHSAHPGQSGPGTCKSAGSSRVRSLSTERQPKNLNVKFYG